MESKYLCLDLRTCALIVAALDALSTILVFLAVGLIFSRKSHAKVIEKKSNLRHRSNCFVTFFFPIFFWWCGGKSTAVAKLVVTGCLLYGIIAVKSKPITLFTLICLSLIQHEFEFIQSNVSSIQTLSNEV